MRKLLWAMALVVGAWSFIESPAHACGDKLVSLVRGIRFQRAYQAARPGSILIYAGAGGEQTVKETKLQSSLKRAGHDIQIVTDSSQLDEVLRAQHFDLVLADVAEVADLSQRLASVPHRPRVLPVLYKPTKAQMTAAEKEFGFAIKAPAKSTQHLEAIDEAMK